MKIVPDEADEVPDEGPLMILANEGAVHTPDSVLLTADCGHRVWVAKTGQKMLNEIMGIRTQCLRCHGGLARVAMHIRNGDAAMTPGQMAELRRNFGDREAEGIASMFEAGLDGGDGDPLDVECPLCKAAPTVKCIAWGIPTSWTRTHASRLQALHERDVQVARARRAGGPDA